MTAADFARVLAAAKSPMMAEWDGVYAALVGGGVRPAVALAFFHHESQYGTVGICKDFDTKNLGNVRSPEVQGAAAVIDTPRGKFAKYQTWAQGAADWAKRLRGPKYAGAGLTTVRAVLPRYAPPSDSNDTEGYIAAVLADIARWATPQGGHMDAPKIALAAGHHNSSGGDAYEARQTGELCEAVARACLALDMDVRVVQPDGPDDDSEPGDGTIAGSLDVVGNTVVKWANDGWVPAIFLECHTEGGGGVGAFAIYPDWQGDVDADVRDTLGPDVARRIAAATGLGLGAGGDGVMSERQTGVGASGSRLGIFRTTAPLAASTTRLIIEYGAHDRQPDQGIAESPGFYDRCGQATAEAFAEFLAWSVPDSSTTPPPPQPDPGIVTPQTAWGGAGEIVSYEQILVVRDPASGQVSQKRQIDFTFVGDWVQLTK